MAKKEKPVAKQPPKLKNFTYKARDGVTYTLNERERRFCDAYLKVGAKGVDAVYAAGYNVANVKVAYSIAYENLRKPQIFNYINMKYEEHGFNDDDVVREHLFLIKQHADLGAKAKGVDMYYKKNSNYAPDKVDVVTRNYNELSDEELLERYNAKANAGAKKSND